MTFVVIGALRVKPQTKQTNKRNKEKKCHLYVVLLQELPDTIHVCGRINPEHVWDYLSKVKQAASRVRYFKLSSMISWMKVFRITPEFRILS